MYMKSTAENKYLTLLCKKRQNRSIKLGNIYTHIANKLILIHVIYAFIDT